MPCIILLFKIPIYEYFTFIYRNNTHHILDKIDTLIGILIVYISIAIITRIFIVIMEEDTTTALVLLTIITLILLGVIPTEWKSVCIRKEEIYEKEKEIYFLNSNINELIEIEIKNIKSLKECMLKDIIQVYSINLFIKKIMNKK